MDAFDASRRRGLVQGLRRGLLLAAAAVPVRAAEFPTRPVTLVVPFAPGGVADLSARAVAQGMAAELGQPVIVDNRPSAGTIVGAGTVAQSPPDGHTLLLMSNANAVSQGLFRRLPYDVQKDFAPVVLLGSFDLGFFVPAASPWRSLADLVAAAKSRPGKLVLGTIAVGSTQHLAGELFKQRAGIELLTVPYKGTPAVLNALRAGEVDVTVEILGPMLPQLQAQVLRLLAVGGAQRAASQPEVPTVAEAGVAGYAVASWNALAAPARTPPALLARLNEAANRALARPSVQQALALLGVRPLGGSPAQLRAHLAAEIARWGEAIRAARIAPQ